MRRPARQIAIGLVVAASLFAHAEDVTAPNKPAEALYLQLGQVGLDASRVYQVRGASLNRASIQISLEDGMIGFTEDVMGHVTGAFFEGDGEILLTPPTDVERRSMGLFTGMAILEERFATAYFRFNDDVANELKADLRATENKQEFVDRWGTTAKNLAGGDAMRLLLTFSQMLPVNGGAAGSVSPSAQDRFLHARLQGNKLGVFDVYFDSVTSESVQAGQVRSTESGDPYYDVWTSFSPDDARRPLPGRGAMPQPQSERTRDNRVAIRQFIVDTSVVPPKQIHARARVECDVREGGARTLLFELSRFLQVESVRLGGESVEYIHNPALEGTQLSRRGNDLVAVILPDAARAGQKLEFEFVYGGEVLAEAGNGLLYVGARGTWYPNRGLEMADFDLQFTYPQEWTLVATGKSAPISAERAASQVAGQQVSRWVSERSIPVAGFNLGKYRIATEKVGNVTVEVYAARGVEKDFPKARIEVIGRNPADPGLRPPETIIPSNPSPIQNEGVVAEAGARAIQYFSERFGPYPYSHLALTQMPGRDSQGWPGLVFLSSFAFLTDHEREQLRFPLYRILLQQSIPAHETAHQWWGDLVTWNSYRDQWFSEGLANYCALMMLQERNPAGFRAVMEKYRTDLVEKNKDGMSPAEAGPVTLGTRLLSSRSPDAYEAVSYGRSTWLFHMLRTMLNDAAAQEKGRGGSGAKTTPDPFVAALRKVRDRYEGKAISTRELMDVFAEDLPQALRYEHKNSLDWFLDGWINGVTLPKLELKGVKLLPKGSGMIATGTILQKDAPQDLVTSVPVYAVVPGKQPELLGRVFADGDESTFRLPAPAGTRKIVLDPNETILTAPK
jgi:hypothetical protein